MFSIRESLAFTREQNDALAKMRLTKELADLRQARGDSSEAERAYRECLQMAEGLDLPTPAEKGAWVSSIQFALGNCLLA